jgi:hypothetical protein
MCVGLRAGAAGVDQVVPSVRLSLEPMLNLAKMGVQVLGCAE